MVKYSIIIPVYNAEKYIEKCLESLINQSYQDYEVILVDDGSKDASFSICEKLANKSDKVKVFSKENGGVSSARNLGLDKAQGQYVLFVDSDDFVSSNYLETIDKEIFDYDMLSFFLYSCVINKNGSADINEDSFKKNFIKNHYQKDNLKDFIIHTFFASPCNKVYKKKIIEENNINFDTTCVCYEDLIFNLEYIKHIKNFNIIEDSLYYYRIEESVAHYLKRKWGEPFLISKKLVNKIKEVCSIKKYKKVLPTFLLYSYTAFTTELQFLKATNKNYSQLLDSMVRDKDFVFTMTHLKNVGKKLYIIKMLLKLKCYKKASKIIDGIVK